MIINDNNNVLNGQYNLAQGNAMGINAMNKIVSVISFFEGQLLLRTKRIVTCFFDNNVLQFHPKEIFRIDHLFSADGFSCDSYTQGVALG
jgi:hypothetical protein